jgi:nitrite reductase/ring-hydroxylating ferredoxin subunit
VVSSAIGDRLSRHPQSMLISHLPTGLWLASSLVDLLAIVTGRAFFLRLAQLAQTGGVLGTLALHLLRPAAAPGPNATIEQRDLAHLHTWLNNALPVIFGLSAGLHAGARRRPGAGAVLLTLLGVAGLFASRELNRRREAPAPAAGAGPARDEFVPVAALADLAPGTMKMVEVDNHTIALANVDGTVYAFSNVCPHRSGPLAEGTLRGDVVTCPWHASSFNVRTGAVAGGPARTGIPTYAVRLEGDQILVQRP